MFAESKKVVTTIARASALAATFILLMYVGGQRSAWAQTSAVSPASRDFLGKMSQALSEVAEVARPSVVNISTTTTVTMQGNPFGDFFNDPMFKRFFGEQQAHPRKFKQAALGSGVIVSQDGYILTNNHVIKNADEIKVILYDKREFKGKVIGADPKTDIAVVKIDAKDLPAIKMGESRSLKRGDVVIAIGNPFGLNQTITMGIVSATGRSNVGISAYEDFIQTDAAINPGNSGGALVNTDGDLVGVNTAIFSTSGGYMGIGFAIPSDMANTVAQSIIKYGKVVRGWLGISIQDVTPDLAKSLGLSQDHGALVTDVMKESPAEKAGLKREDLIVEYDGEKVDTTASLRNMAANTGPGKEVAVKVIRDGKDVSLTVKVGEMPEAKVAKAVEHENALMGVSVQDITAGERDSLGLPHNVKGVVVTDLSETSPAGGVLAKNDVILEIDRKEVRGVKDYEKLASKIGPKDSVLLLIYRQGGYIYVTIKP
ncbi:MAG: DegQ family serine endoprotease [Nitrospiraceae bacterium]|nr:DegQ family serine endoprotease [Nitrospiraceae bacterium]